MAGGAARVLDSLRAAGDEGRSGEVLSQQLEVSRAQIWKHVEALRKRGYRIDGEPGGGYRLLEAPDRLYPEEILPRLETRWIGRTLHHYESTDSTNRIAFDLARQGAPAGTAVIAEAQTAGRGRLGRTFFSPAYQNLYVSIVLRPLLLTSDAPTLIPTAAIAVADAIAARLPESAPVEIKWPNDVLLAGLKTSGILMEMSAEATRVDFAILGIGVNLNVDRNEFPDEFRALATSLRSHSGQSIDRVGFACRLFEALEEVLEEHARKGFAGLRPRYEARFAMRGRKVTVSEMQGATLSGTVRGIADDGALELEKDDAEIVRVIAGDVTLAKSDPNTELAASPGRQEEAGS